jgi:hypothetical protein
MLDSKTIRSNFLHSISAFPCSKTIRSNFIKDFSKAFSYRSQFYDQIRAQSRPVLNVILTTRAKSVFKSFQLQKVISTTYFTVKTCSQNLKSRTWRRAPNPQHFAGSNFDLFLKDFPKAFYSPIRTQNGARRPPNPSANSPNLQFCFCF